MAQVGDKGSAVEDVSKSLGDLNFHHPFTPYDVQEQFMRTVYDVLETGDGQIGILESPTGTVSTPSPIGLREPGSPKSSQRS